VDHHDRGERAVAVREVERAREARALAGEGDVELAMVGARTLLAESRCGRVAARALRVVDGLAA
jgi:hypothetical protein